MLPDLLREPRHCKIAAAHQSGQQGPVSVHDCQHQGLAADLQRPDERWQAVGGEIAHGQAIGRPARQHTQTVGVCADEEPAVRITGDRFERGRPLRRHFLQQHEVCGLTREPIDERSRVRVVVIQVGSNDRERITVAVRSRRERLTARTARPQVHRGDERRQRRRSPGGASAGMRSRAARRRRRTADENGRRARTASRAGPPTRRGTRRPGQRVPAWPAAPTMEPAPRPRRIESGEVTQPWAAVQHVQTTHTFQAAR